MGGGAACRPGRQLGQAAASLSHRRRWLCQGWARSAERALRMWCRQCWQRRRCSCDGSRRRAAWASRPPCASWRSRGASSAGRRRRSQPGQRAPALPTASSAPPAPPCARLSTSTCCMRDRCRSWTCQAASRRARRVAWRPMTRAGQATPTPTTPSRPCAGRGASASGGWRLRSSWPWLEGRPRSRRRQQQRGLATRWLLQPRGRRLLPRLLPWLLCQEMRTRLGMTVIRMMPWCRPPGEGRAGGLQHRLGMRPSAGRCCCHTVPLLLPPPPSLPRRSRMGPAPLALQRLLPQQDRMWQQRVGSSSILRGGYRLAASASSSSSSTREVGGAGSA